MGGLFVIVVVVGVGGGGGGDGGGGDSTDSSGGGSVGDGFGRGSWYRARCRVVPIRDCQSRLPWGLHIESNQFLLCELCNAVNQQNPATGRRYFSTGL